MKKKLISLLAASSMIATAFVGMVQTAYAADPNIRIDVADGASATQKVLTLYYENPGADGVNSLQGTLTFTGGKVTIDSAAITIAAKYTGADKDSAVFYFAEEEDGGASSADGSFATATITIPENTDITAFFELEAYENSDFEDLTPYIGTISAVVSTKPTEPISVPAAVSAVEKKDSYNGTDMYGNQTADVYGVEIELNDDAVSGAKVYFDDAHQGTVDFGGKFSGSGKAVFAVILVSETGAPLPSLDDATITPIVAE